MSQFRRTLIETTIFGQVSNKISVISDSAISKWQTALLILKITSGFSELEVICDRARTGWKPRLINCELMTRS